MWGRIKYCKLVVICGDSRRSLKSFLVLVCSQRKGPSITSIHSIMMYRDRGSIWLTPLVELTKSLGSSLLQFSKIRSLIQLFHIWWNPNSCKHLGMKSHSNLLYAFFTSNLSVTHTDLLFRFLNLCMIWWVDKVLSWIALLELNVLWNGEMILSSKALNLLTKILEIIF